MLHTLYPSFTPNLIAFSFLVFLQVCVIFISAWFIFWMQLLLNRPVAYVIFCLAEWLLLLPILLMVVSTQCFTVCSYAHSRSADLARSRSQDWYAHCADLSGVRETVCQSHRVVRVGKIWIVASPGCCARRCMHETTQNNFLNITYMSRTTSWSQHWQLPYLANYYYILKTD